MPPNCFWSASKPWDLTFELIVDRTRHTCPRVDATWSMRCFPEIDWCAEREGQIEAENRPHKSLKTGGI